MLKPLDLTVLSFLVAQDVGERWTQQSVASGLGIAQSSVHRALRQLDRSGLLVGDVPQHRALRELLVHAVRVVYPAELGPPVRGVPTAWSAGVVDGVRAGEPAFVWPLDAASGFGTSVEPLHPCVPESAARNPSFHEWMALVDVLRVGRVRDRERAVARLDELLRERA